MQKGIMPRTTTDLIGMVSRCCQISSGEISVFCGQKPGPVKVWPGNFMAWPGPGPVKKVGPVGP